MNYTLYLHCIVHDYGRARPLYISLMEYMHQRGPDNAVVLYAFAMFLAATLEEDWIIIDALLERARAADNNKHKFDLAEHGFFRQAVIMNPRDPLACVNWALVQQYIHRNFAEAEQYYLRALDGAPSVRALSCTTVSLPSPSPQPQPQPPQPPPPPPPPPPPSPPSPPSSSSSSCTHAIFIPFLLLLRFLLAGLGVHTV
jgi:hypothetical protein